MYIVKRNPNKNKNEVRYVEKKEPPILVEEDCEQIQLMNPNFGMYLEEGVRKQKEIQEKKEKENDEKIEKEKNKKIEKEKLNDDEKIRKNGKTNFVEEKKQEIPVGAEITKEELYSRKGKNVEECEEEEYVSEDDIGGYYHDDDDYDYYSLDIIAR